MVATERTKERLLIAARDHYLEVGPAHFSLREVARRCEVSAAAVYRHFDSKEALVNALFQRQKGLLGEAILTGFPADAPFREQFHHFWTRVCTYATKEPIALRFLELHHHASYLDDTSRAMEMQLLGTAKTIVDGAIASQILKPVRGELLMAIVWGSFRALVQAGCDGTLALDDATVADAESCVWEAIRR